MNHPLPLVDWELALERAHHNQALAHELFTLLIKELPQQLAELKLFAQADEPQKMKALLHKIQGGCCYCGVPALSQLVQELHLAVKHSDENWREKFEAVEMCMEAMIKTGHIPQ